MDFSFWEMGSARTRLSTLRKKFRISKTFYMSRSVEARQTLAQSDGELSSSDVEGQGSYHSLNSLPSVRTTRPSGERAVASWAVSFERLLQDPLGVQYFTEFLKKEFSAENILFWQACERFQDIPAQDHEQLAQESRRIYEEYFSSSSLNPVNIDHQAWVGADMLDKPRPDMFKVQQMQIFNLMKFDSYARFVRSALYQDCMMAEVEGRALPDLCPTSCSSTPSSELRKKKRLKSGKSLPIGVEVAGSGASGSIYTERSTRRSFKKKDRREVWGELLDGEGSLRRRSQGSLNSTASLDLGFLSSFTPKPEKDGSSVSSADGEPDAKPVKYCCVYLPDGTASLAAVRHGLSIREMLSGICQKRGLCLADVTIYLAGSKQKALVLDQDSAVLTDQEVTLENRIGFELEISVIKKIVRISAKSSKSVREALQPIAKKYGVGLQQVALRLSGESDTLDLDRPVTTVAGQRLVLEMIPDLDGRTSGESEGTAAHLQLKGRCSLEVTRDSPKTDCSPVRMYGDSLDVSSVTRHRDAPAAKNTLHRRTYDIEGLVELLNRVQGCRAEDQRGLLCKENLVLPDFLQLPSKEEGDPELPGPQTPTLSLDPDVSSTEMTDPEVDLKSSEPQTAHPQCDPQRSGPHRADPEGRRSVTDQGSLLDAPPCQTDASPKPAQQSEDQCTRDIDHPLGSQSSQTVEGPPPSPEELPPSTETRLLGSHPSQTMEEPPPGLKKLPPSTDTQPLGPQPSQTAEELPPSTETQPLGSHPSQTTEGPRPGRSPSQYRGPTPGIPSLPDRGGAPSQHKHTTPGVPS